MKPPKPRISKPRLAWRWREHKGVWEPYYRVTKTEGGKQREKLYLVRWEGDPKRLDALYWELRSGRSEAQKAPEQQTWRECSAT